MLTVDCALLRFCACVLDCCAVLTGNDLTCTWSTPTLTAPPRLRHVVAMAPKGRMLVFGGQGENDEVFDPLVSTQAQRLATMVCVCVCVWGRAFTRARCALHQIGVSVQVLDLGDPTEPKWVGKGDSSHFVCDAGAEPKVCCPSLASREPAHTGVGIAPAAGHRCKHHL